MTPKKPPPRHPDGSAARSRGIDHRNVITSLEKLSPEQKIRVDALLPQAERLMEEVEDKMVALATAAS